MTNTRGLGAATLGGEDRTGAVAAVKALLRASGGDDDALIAAMAEAALGVAEQFLGQVLIAREVSVTLDARAGWQLLPVGPVGAITSVAAVGTALPIADYAVDVDARGLGWVRVGRRARVIARAGLGADWASLPAAVRHGVAMLAAHLFDDREGAKPVPAAVTALWRPFRRLALMPEMRA
ncbi:hypothetical protein [Sphingomonas sp.]|uniref:head-tail connector protein n=1 Tax=Sphingomonas sp. TaxID=28214 RepID=UPI0035C80BC0